MEVKSIEQGIREVMQQKGVSQTKLAELLGYKTVAGITNRLDTGKNSLRFDIAFKFLNVLGYEIVIRDKENPDVQYVVKGVKSDYPAGEDGRRKFSKRSK